MSNQIDFYWDAITISANGYARWVSKDQHYSIQRFVFKTVKGISTPTDPYYCLYDLYKGSVKLGEFSTFGEVHDYVLSL